MLWQYLVEAPYLPGGETACDATALVEMWPHQRRVVEETSSAWPDGKQVQKQKKTRCCGSFSMFSLR
jgi:hypothetical protein